MSVKQIQCYGCSVLCDDIYVELDENGKITTTINSCFRGNSFIRNCLTENRLHQAIQKKMGLEMYLSFDEVKSILKEEINNADTITFYGLGAISYQDQLQVLGIIKELREQKKKIFIHGLDSIKEILDIAYQSTIGQCVNNADVFLFWDCDPTHSHPKLFSKLLFSRGMFRVSGKEMKKFLLLQHQDTDLSRLKDILFDISNQSSSEFINEFMKLLNGTPLEEISLGSLSIENLRTLKTFLQATEYGIILCSSPLKEHVSVPEFANFLQKLNEFAKGRFMCITLTPTSNDMGVINAVTAIFGNEINSLLIPPSSPSDLAIIFGGEYLRDEYNPIKLVFPERKRILFDNYKSEVSKNTLLIIPYAIPGIECDGTAIRLDGINVDLHAWVPVGDDIKRIQDIFQDLVK